MGAGSCAVQNALRSEVDASNGGCVGNTGESDVTASRQFRRARRDFGAMGSQLVRLRAVPIVNHERKSRPPEPPRDSRTYVTEADPSELAERVNTFVEMSFAIPFGTLTRSEICTRSAGPKHVDF